MSKPKYAVSNGGNVIGVLWEDDNLGKIFVSTGEKIDLAFDLKIMSIETSKKVDHIDLRDFILKALPR